jgi:hypothetical protein
MLRRAIGSPRPVPVVFVEKYGSNTRSSASASMPTPESAIRMVTKPSRVEDVSSRRPRPGMA